MDMRIAACRNGGCATGSLVRRLRGLDALGSVGDVTGLAEMQAQLKALLPVMRALNTAAMHLAEALPQSRTAVSEALVEVNAAIDDYCSVTLEHSGLLTIGAAS